MTIDLLGLAPSSEPRMPLDAGVQAAHRTAPTHMQQLVDHNTARAESLAKHLYAHRQCEEFEYGDFRQLAMIGLLESARTFDPSRGVDFWSYAQKRVKGAVLSGVASLSEKQRQITDTGFAWRAFDLDADQDSAGTNDLGTLEDLVSLTNNLAVARLVAQSATVDSLPTLSVTHSGYERFEFQQLLFKIREIVLGLTNPIREILDSHYWQAEPFKSIGERLRLSKGRISQLHSQGLAELRARCSRRRLISSNGKQDNQNL